MKKIFITFSIFASILFTSCEYDAVVYEGTAVGLSQSSAQVSVPDTGTSETFPVTITSPSSEARTFGLEYVGDAPAAGGVTLGTITVPADSYEGTATVDFDFSAINLADGVTDTFSIKATSTSTEVFGTVLAIEYFKAVICNDATFTINTDFYAGETGFSITDDATGNVVYTMPALGNGVQTITADIFLADGCYTATITDSYGDGQLDGTVTGNYTITCSILTFASGGGGFGSSQSRSFCVNQ
ncbi:hypothetical protein [uncultured Nonlabens sp.]|uniref:hypothetical protein n=1 Tax=uncultured Nonlabens sp. TaxID=859306 RepID=UPI0030D92DDC|tara:strand:- start:68966 stop:69694 length:729 start_codon:yes stop_codon:yes gene_type:complete